MGMEFRGYILHKARDKRLPLGQADAEDGIIHALTQKDFEL
jgi:hypothetical protein